MGLAKRNLQRAFGLRKDDSPEEALGSEVVATLGSFAWGALMTGGKAATYPKLLAESAIRASAVVGVESIEYGMEKGLRHPLLWRSWARAKCTLNGAQCRNRTVGQAACR